MSLSGEMPLIGGARFGVRAKGKPLDNPCFALPTITVHVHGGPVPRPTPQAVGRITPASFPAQLNTAKLSFPSATGKPLYVLDKVRGSDGSNNAKVNRNFRGVILEFITPTAEGNNVRVKCSTTGRVFRVKNKEIRHAV